MTCNAKLVSANENAFEYARTSLGMDIEAADAYASQHEAEWAQANEDPCTCMECTFV